MHQNQAADIENYIGLGLEDLIESSETASLSVRISCILSAENYFTAAESLIWSEEA